MDDKRYTNILPLRKKSLPEDRTCSLVPTRHNLHSTIHPQPGRTGSTGSTEGIKKAKSSFLKELTRNVSPFQKDNSSIHESF